MKLRSSLILMAVVLAFAAPRAGSAQEAELSYARASHGTRWLESPGGLSIKILVEESNLGGDEVELGAITFPPGSGAGGGGHTHSRIEIFYILSGQLDHVVNGESHRLKPGMVGIVRPGDEVIHRVVGDEPVTAVVIWAPGGEIDRIAGFFEERPVEPQ